MIRQRDPIFSLHEVLLMATMAALGGVTSSALSLIRATVHAVVMIPGGMQLMAGLHTLWVVLAAVFIRKLGAATLTGLL